MASILDSVSRVIHQHPASTNPSFLVGITVLTTLAAITVSRFVFREEKVKIIKGPATTLLPKLTDAEKALLPYPPDALPGARDVESPYGTTRVYEWGPEDGRKVLLIHGITPPSLALGAIARGLAEKGCRVMLFDGWGRGYSDSPADLPHDERLYASQILIAITSSPLSWTGGPDGGFSLIGYSLGGGISMTFTSYFPDMVKSLVLLCPTSLIRDSRIGAQKYMRQVFEIVPESWLIPLLKKRLQTPLFPGEDGKDAATEEAAAPPKLAIASLKYPHISALSAVHWGVHTHHGFIRSFISNALYAPGANQHAAWKRLGAQKRTILIVTATQDPIIVPEELKPDVEELLEGMEAKVEWRSVVGAHNICDTAPEEIVGHICEVWGI
ncbi:related to alpha/beta hydrolase family protein [Phialocephala subalpina]|uniref:Related to alpha/beta hydrolase family protein n=1 Tax=Phialocephala subalpina TaxID=576137 RepID=A0A1L7XC38_9HELO|nr:related to alpha/beta hydrolase family protein [Phialocephala subalpina]